MELILIIAIIAMITGGSFAPKTGAAAGTGRKKGAGRSAHRQRYCRHQNIHQIRLDFSVAQICCGFEA